MDAIGGTYVDVVAVFDSIVSFMQGCAWHWAPLSTHSWLWTLASTRCGTCSTLAARLRPCVPQSLGPVNHKTIIRAEDQGGV
ncbi:hypothetical protein PC116_g10103 [Phytophthora cactorum]|nr:hypothetical protein Pcac1_g6587 [Phytophthora cactorum]KAG2916848.1 hypothetical protein PC114_g7349 [Phytophthora cactorum]KAG3028506.1 hypothetical protein PC119_g6987 [Phytophthora cactorum]KAG3175190.1 hypothetical protein C6341_g9578 [Phytophthora cactorum]KAG3187456.1 hypothetical protein PC128_g12569 [Phytophthora cactorum]